MYTPRKSKAATALRWQMACADAADRQSVAIGSREEYYDPSF